MDYRQKRDRRERYWNAFLVGLTLLIAGYMLFQLGRWVTREEAPEKRERVFIPPVEEPVDQCMILLPPEVSEEPRYRIGTGAECFEPVSP